LIATTEPVLAAVLEIADFTGPGCGRSTVRVAPDGHVLPCTYWAESRLTLADLTRLGGGIVETAEFIAARQVPMACEDCPCRGGGGSARAGVAAPVDAHEWAASTLPTRTVRSPVATGSRSTGNGRSARISQRWEAPAPPSSRHAEPSDHGHRPPPACGLRAAS